MKIMIAAVFYFLYWGVCFLGTGTDRKNLIGLRSYPDEVQTRVQSDHQLGQAVPKAKSTAAILLSNLLLFTVVFSVLGLALKSDNTDSRSIDGRIGFNYDFNAYHSIGVRYDLSNALHTDMFTAFDSEIQADGLPYDILYSTRSEEHTSELQSR